MMRERRARRPAIQHYRLDSDYDPEAIPQYIQISVNILEARKLIWSSSQGASSYVIAILGQKKLRTTVRKNMEEPIYREYLVFEMFMSIREIQRSSLWLAVMEPKCCAPPRIVGEATIDLGAIWAQPNHQVYHKWAQLTLPREEESVGSAGFLKVDISLILRGELQVMPAVISDEKAEHTLLLPTSAEQQRANYQVTVHAAYCLPSYVAPQSDRRCGKPPSTYVRVSFCGLVAKTSAQIRTIDPAYSERISMVEMFPNMNQLLRFEVCSVEGCCKVMAAAELQLEDVSHDGENGFLPTFGPSLLHMYAPCVSVNGEEGPYHKGALLVSLRTIVPYYQDAFRSVSVEAVSHIYPEYLWQQEDFCLYCPIFEISMLNHLCGDLAGLAITMPEVPNSSRKCEEEFTCFMGKLKQRKLHYTGPLEVYKTSPYGCIEFPNQFPVLQLAIRLPDFRFRIYVNNIVQGIYTQLEQALAKVEKRLAQFDYSCVNELMDYINKAIDDAAGNILKYLDIVQYSSNPSPEENFQQYTTELDQKQLALQKEEIEKIYNQLCKKGRGESFFNLCCKGTKDSLVGTRKGVKIMLAETKAIVECLKSTVYKTIDGWPTIVIWLLNGGSRVAYTKISAADVIYSVIPEQCGSRSGKIQTVYMKPLKCPNQIHNPPSSCVCIAAKVELLVWMGLYRQRHSIDSRMPIGYTVKHKEIDMHVKSSLLMVECRAFIYKAKLTTVSRDNLNNTYNAFVRFNALCCVKETVTQLKTSTPTWNQVLKIQKMMHTSQERLLLNPPYFLVEIYDDIQRGKEDLIGRFEIQPVVDDRVGYAPKLQWYDIYHGIQNTGQILMSVQLLQKPERLLKTTLYAPHSGSFYGSAVKEAPAEMDLDAIEPLPASLIPKSTSYKVDVYWWGLRDVNVTRKPCVVLEIDDLVIKSDIISDKKTNNSNFPNGRATQTFESPLSEDYSPKLSIRLYDSATFGRTVFLGTNVVKNVSKYVVDWIPKNEREASLKSVSIMSADFCPVGPVQMLFVKKESKRDESDEYSSNASYKYHTITNYQAKLKRSVWRKIFFRKEPSEEKITLLPVYAKEKNQIKVVRKIPKATESADWWTRFFQSEKTDMEGENLTCEYITIYDYELEYQPEFSKFKDWCSTLKFYNGKKSGIPDRDEQLQCGYLKAGIAIYRWPPPPHIVAVSVNGVDLNRGYFDEHPNNVPAKYLVRVYVVRAMGLSRDFAGKSDPYVTINCGRKQLGDRNNFIANTTEPIFGKLFEFSCTFPEDYLLSISLYDHDIASPDELIGTTTIDLEDRVYSKHRARIGLAPYYCLSGPSKWRDSVKPSLILEELCAKNHLPPPLFPDAYSVIVNGVEYKDNERTSKVVERKENICLSILHKWQTLPICGYQLVPEHVETRTLFHTEKPGIERGKVQLWVDIFPLDANSFIPAPCDITPRKLEEYELRVIVWDVHNTILGLDKKRSWKTADLYVKMWIGPIDHAQHTDIHYNSVSGEGNFNWRMVFNFLYNHAERKLVNKEKCPYTEFEEVMAPILEVQLVESTNDSFLGSLSLNLNSMYPGAKLAHQCTLASMETGKKINLFSLRSIRAWWPMKFMDTAGNDVPAGVIDLEITLLPRAKAVVMPCGTGRDPPFPLPEPMRQAPSNETCKNWSGFVKEMASGGHLKELLICIMIILVVWFVAYLVYLAIPSAENIMYQSKRKRNRYRNVEGIIRTMSAAS